MTNFDFDYEIPQEAMDAAQTGFLLTPPKDASEKGNWREPGNGIATWSQVVEVTASSVGEAKNKDGSVAQDTASFEVEFTIPADAQRSDGTPDPNAGRSIKQWYRLCGPALKDASHQSRKGTMFNLGRLKALLVAAGFEPTNNIKPFFVNQEDGTLAFVVGKPVRTIMKRSWYDGKPKDEITEFLPANLG